MRWCSTILLGLVATVPLAAQEPPKPAAPPWSGTFTMKLRGQDRTFVRYQEKAWLHTNGEDFAQAANLPRGELLVVAKFRRSDANGAQLWVPSALTARGEPALWSGRVEGDNLYVFGTVVVGDDGKPLLLARAAVPAPADAERVAARLAGIPPSDAERRLEAAVWARAEAERQANREWWLEAADRIVADLADAQVAAAESARDTGAVLRAMDLVLRELKDERRAARLGSIAWVRGAPGGERVGERLRGLGMEFYAQAWRPRAEALTMEFEDRFNALSFRDAEGYYRLGRWIDERGDLVQQSKDLAHRAYSQGLRADANHAGIRRELGLPPVGGRAVLLGGDIAAAALTRDGITVPPPAGWGRSDAQAGDITWVDPNIETSTVTASILAGGAFDQAWAEAVATQATQPGYAPGTSEDLAFGDIVGRRIDFAVGVDAPRHGTLAVLTRAGAAHHVRLLALAKVDDIPGVRQRVLDLLAQATIAATEGGAPPPVAPPSNGETPAEEQPPTSGETPAPEAPPAEAPPAETPPPPTE